jgi:hypothetical protein
MTLEAWVGQAIDTLPLDEQNRRLRAAVIALAERAPAEAERAHATAARLEQRVDELEHRLALAERICRAVAAGHQPDPTHVAAWRNQTRGAA